MFDDCFQFKRVAVRSAIMKMSEFEFMVRNDFVGQSYTFRLNPFMKGQELMAMLENRVGVQAHDLSLRVGDDELLDSLSLLLQGLHVGQAQGVVSRFVRVHFPIVDSAALPTTPLSQPPC
mgnify:CR=1 FL=1